MSLLKILRGAVLVAALTLLLSACDREEAAPPAEPVTPPAAPAAPAN